MYWYISLTYSAHSCGLSASEVSMSSMCSCCARAAVTCPTSISSGSVNFRPWQVLATTFAGSFSATGPRSASTSGCCFTACDTCVLCYGNSIEWRMGVVRSDIYRLQGGEREKWILHGPPICNGFREPQLNHVLTLLTFPAAFLSTKVFAMLPRAALGLASGFWKNDFPPGRRVVLDAFSFLACGFERRRNSNSENSLHQLNKKGSAIRVVLSWRENKNQTAADTRRTPDFQLTWTLRAMFVTVVKWRGFQSEEWMKIAKRWLLRFKGVQKAESVDIAGVANGAWQMRARIWSIA